MERWLICAASIVFSAGCRPYGAPPKAPNAVVKDEPRGSAEYLELIARRALVHVDTWHAGSSEPKPGTAFVVQRDHGHGVAYLLTALHVLQADPHEPQVVRVRLRGACIDELDTKQPGQLPLSARASEDIALVRVNASQQSGKDCPVVRLSTPADGSARLRAYGFAPAQDAGPLPEPAVASGAMHNQKRGGYNVITTDARLLPGMSGGPALVNGYAVGVVRGRVVSGNAEECLIAPVTSLAADLQRHAAIQLAPQVPPQGVPPLPTTLVDRPESEGKIREALLGSDQRPFVLLFGGAGTGKTVLATKVALDLIGTTQRYSDGLFFVEVKERSDEQALLLLASQVYGNAPQEPPELLRDRLRAHFAERDALVILDDLRSPALPPLLMAALGDASVLATSRRSYDHQGVSRVVEIKDLARASSVDLIVRTLERHGRVIEPAEAGALAARVGDNALALHLAASAMGARQLPYDELMGRLGENLLDPLICSAGAKADQQCSQRAAIEVSWHQLRPEQRTALVGLGQTANSPIPIELAKALIGPGHADLVDHLVLASLVSRGEERGQLLTHPLIHAWARDYARDPDYTRAARAARERAAKTLLDQATRSDARTWDASLAVHIEDAQSAAIARGDYEAARDVVAAWDEILDRSGQWLSLIRMWKALATSNAPADIIASAWHMTAIYQFQRADYAAAREGYARSIRIKEERGDHSGLAASYHQLGLLEQLQGNYRAAREWYEKSLRIEEEMGDGSRMSAGYHQLGVLEQLAGNYDAAREWCEKSLRIDERLGDRAGVGKSYYQLGRLEELQENYAAAGELYERALFIAEELGDRADRAMSYHALGSLEQQQGRYGPARDWYQKALRIAEDLGNPASLAKSYHQLGLLEQLQGNNGAAEEWYERSIHIMEELGDRVGLAASYHQRGVLKHLEGDHDAAREWYQKSLRLEEDLGNRAGMATTYLAIGRLLSDRQQWSEATLYTVRALVALREIRNPSMGGVLRDLSRQAEALGGPNFRSIVEGEAGPDVADAVWRAMEEVEGEASP